MSKDVTFSINLKLNGQDAVKQVSVDIDEIRSAIDMATGSAKKLSENLILFNQGAELVKNLSGSFNDVVGRAECQSFAQAMAAANTMVGKGGEEFSQLKDDVAELAKEMDIRFDAAAIKAAGAWDVPYRHSGRRARR